MTTHENNDNSNNDNQSRMDRLVAGELPDDQRREFIGWCDEDPVRWRQCALAFLEAQTWRQGIAAWTEEPMLHKALPIAASSARVRSDRPRWRSLTTIAAGLAIAFCGGLAVRDTAYSWRVSSQPAEPMRHDSASGSSGRSPAYVTVAVRTNLNPDVPGTLQIPVAAPETTSPTPSETPTMPDYVRKQWEKRGYQVAQTQRFFNAKLPDGRDVVVPVNGVEVKFIGKPVY